MEADCKALLRRQWFLALTLVATCEHTWGVNLPPGASVTVAAGEPAQSWALNAANLSVSPGGQTLDISTTTGSTVTLNGATVSATSLRALVLTESTGVITDSTLTSTGNTGLSVVRGNDVNVPGSTATVTNSVITAAGRGLNVSGGSTATVINSTITGTGAVGASVAGDGLGISLVGGEAILQGSQATGSTHGAGLFSNIPSTATPTLVLDGSGLTSGTGSAILVGNIGTPPMRADIEVLNGSTLTSGNGVLLEVGLASSPAGSVTAAQMTIDNSHLVGDVQVLAGSTADIVMRNGATLTGTMSNISSLDMNGSSVTGNVVELSGSAAPVSLSAGSTFTGSLTNIGSLRLDNSAMTGDIVQDPQTPASLTLANGGRLTGTVTGAQGMSVDNTSVFNMVNDSSVGALTLEGGTVNLRGGQGAFRTLTASSLSGNGTFALGTDLAGHLSDLVNITGNASGSHTLEIQNTGAEPVKEDYAQQVVHTGSGPASFSVAGGRVDAGTFTYDLQQRGTDWYLVQATVDEGGAGGGDGGTGGEEPVISPSAEAVIGVFSAAPTVWYGELTTLRSRMGELRNGHEQGGDWVRTYGNKYNVSATDQVQYSQTQQGISFGADTALSSDGKWLVGVLGGYSNSQLDMQLGTTGQVNSYYLGLYSTWMSKDGYYIDAIVKANRFKNKADVTMSDGNNARGDYNNYGTGGSVEAGRHFDLSNGWFIEPYVQGSALWVQGENYSLDNGLNARSNKADSFLGKVGTHVGRTIPLESGGFVQPYVKLAAAHEFAKSNEVRVNNTTFSDDLSGTRGEVGAGMAAQISNVLQLHADVDYSNGKNIEQPWGVSVGLRFTW
ncbi:autotransporter outer membrane beta-barrel domain-containing protein [Pseudomonas sp. CCI3.2]|uniref:autotransporter outer membrane beta-barrel domain-containing protein n=1 Tax=unclassified Pseudomonas TaxID=196821 RepID=UPI002AC8F3E7|nr:MULTISPECIES: autotransporter outer membrane beta-barrel domain-containing protein [unclassified Pseudomonas]MEB0078138.1 autotransporter outer membrane beta-barrel domain-containing protein [Pseudomonas sp. MH10out]MEB0093416.1 autotransporter outer membrane beta-barrel domain-containing protein [Pseudomonas sp. CCI4.2]MEB0102192.1 autotransporter outer membrane beta-barrel domain-containing protein [Pseudomonas sp. CCI3.2]MEB0132325.1 autotransporter outer membrane beta-barrel domain-conta